MKLTYERAGVEQDSADRLIDSLAGAFESTRREGAIGSVGGFGALFDLKACGYRDPLLVAATDGVGTKLLVAIEGGQVGSIGQDLVAMCVNDLVCQGAQPLFFLDYLATGKLDEQAAKEVIASVARACRSAGCALIGGETAQMPGMYREGHFDLAGFAVGAVERDQVWPDRKAIRPGDRLWGLAADGLHSNGYSLARAVISRMDLAWSDKAPWSEDSTVAEDFLRPTLLYSDPVLRIRESHGPDRIKAAAHITGGGLTGNIPRVLADGLSARIRADSLPAGGFPGFAVDQGLIEMEEAHRTFNMGIGMVLVADGDVDLSGEAIEIGGIEEHLPGGRACSISA